MELSIEWIVKKKMKLYWMQKILTQEVPERNLELFYSQFLKFIEFQELKKI